jgi:hypothetical protein
MLHEAPTNLFEDVLDAATLRGVTASKQHGRFNGRSRWPVS